VLDICCGPGRHAELLAALGYEITGADRDADPIARAAKRVPSARFIDLDQCCHAALGDTFDAAMNLWQSFGWFDSATNDRVLGDIAARLRRGGRLLLDVYHPGFMRSNAGTQRAVRAPGCRSITNVIAGDRLASGIAYLDGSSEVMDFELFEPDDLASRAAAHGFRLMEACCWWDRGRPPSPSEQPYQIVLELAHQQRLLPTILATNGRVGPGRRAAPGRYHGVAAVGRRVPYLARHAIGDQACGASHRGAAGAFLTPVRARLPNRAPHPGHRAAVVTVVGIVEKAR